MMLLIALVDVTVVTLPTECAAEFMLVGLPRTQTAPRISISGGLHENVCHVLDAPGVTPLCFEVSSALLILF